MAHREDRTGRARALRQSATYAEDKLWQALRGGRVAGHKFRRQHAIGRHFADFACESLRLVIELDGGVHDEKAQALRDLLREQEIEAQGWRVLRFRNEEVTGDLPGVLARIAGVASLARS